MRSAIIAALVAACFATAASARTSATERRSRPPTSGNAIAVAIYELKSDGTLEGWWTLADEAGVGTKTFIPAR